MKGKKVREKDTCGRTTIRMTSISYQKTMQTSGQWKYIVKNLKDK
jgi:hypothetical protein